MSAANPGNFRAPFPSFALWAKPSSRYQFPGFALPPQPGLHVERRLVHLCDLLAQLEDAGLPVAPRIAPGKGGRKSRIVPAPRNPRRIMDQAQGAQRLDEMKLASIEVMEALVAGQKLGELPGHFARISRERHPHILHSGTH